MAENAMQMYVTFDPTEATEEQIADMVRDVYGVIRVVSNEAH